MDRRLARAGLGAGLTVALALGATGCGVEVPDDVSAGADPTTTTVAVTTTAVPTSADALEQALIDNGYSAAEARCGAANLREVLDDAEVRSIVEADTIEDISPGVARRFADALRPCVEGGAGGGATDGTPDPPPGSGGGEPDGGSGDRMPGAGDEGDGTVTRSRFLAALLASGVPDAQARCIVERLYAELDQDEIDQLFRAGSPDEVPPDVLATFDAVTDACV